MPHELSDLDKQRLRDLYEDLGYDPPEEPTIVDTLEMLGDKIAEIEEVDDEEGEETDDDESEPEES